MPADQGAFVVGPGQGRIIGLGEFGMTLKADAEQTHGVVSVLEAEEPPGFGPPIHVHHDSAEAFYVREGEDFMYLDDREFTCPAGSFIFIPLGVRHRLQSRRRAGPEVELLLPCGDGRILR